MNLIFSFVDLVFFLLRKFDFDEMISSTVNGYTPSASSGATTRANTR